MINRTKYQVMDSSIVTDDDGNNYPDLATFPLNQLRIHERPTDYKLTQKDLYRFFDLSYEYYGSFELYDFLILWLNDITNISDENNFGRNIKFYSKKDIDDWYVQYMKSE